MKTGNLGTRQFNDHVLLRKYFELRNNYVFPFIPERGTMTGHPVKGFLRETLDTRTKIVLIIELQFNLQNWLRDFSTVLHELTK